MKVSTLASIAVIVFAATAYAQAPPPPPIIIGIVPEAGTGIERISVNGLVGRAPDGSPVIRAQNLEYTLLPAQHSLLLPLVGKRVQVIGTRQRSERGQLNRIMVSSVREAP